MLRNINLPASFTALFTVLSFSLAAHANANSDRILPMPVSPYFQKSLSAPNNAWAAMPLFTRHKKRVMVAKADPKDETIYQEYTPKAPPPRKQMERLDSNWLVSTWNLKHPRKVSPTDQFIENLPEDTADINKDRADASSSIED